MSLMFGTTFYSSIKITFQNLLDVFQKLLKKIATLNLLQNGLYGDGGVHMLGLNYICANM